ncbi:MAG: prepilin peptidase [Rickettsiales bacterium]|jgi:prepilin signal peptidase PulO-like enzyme (type II secretory pathway)|nr:prepilin peptidase [Rickettsiales bacterium]
MEVGEVLRGILAYGPGLFFSLVIGMMFGSCATVAVCRLPRNMPCLGIKTSCIHCGHALSLQDFFPIFSLLLTKGKCRYCQTPIESPWIYFWVEVAVSLLAVIVFFRFGLGDERYVLGIALAVTSVIIMAIDGEHRRIPESMLIIFAMLGIAYRVLLDHSIFGMVAGALAAGGLGVLFRYCYIIIKEPATIPGWDYVKLGVTVGIWISWTGIIAGIPLMIVLLLLTGIACMALTKKKGIPLSIPLLLALLVSVLDPDVIVFPVGG